MIPGVLRLCLHLEGEGMPYCESNLSDIDVLGDYMIVILSMHGRLHLDSYKRSETCFPATLQYSH
jgi:hypothetical protein